MGAKLTEYDHALRKRLEVARKREKFKQIEMAQNMGVTIERYKRFIYGEAKRPVEAIARLLLTTPVDPDYLLNRKEGGINRLISYLLGSSNEEKAVFFMNLARIYREKENRTDYMTDKGLLIETRSDKTE